MFKLVRGMGNIVPNMHLLPNLDQRWMMFRHHLCNHVSGVQSLEVGRLRVAVVRELVAQERSESGRGGENVMEVGG
jgi:hypothetical protein